MSVSTTVWWLVNECEPRTNAGKRQHDPRVQVQRTSRDVALRQAAHKLCTGELVAFPTETVYGLGANALDPDALNKVFAAKRRPLDNPLIAHIAAMSQLEMLVSEVSTLARRIMAAFWPGPLSILLPARPDLPRELTAGLPRVAVRMPAHDLALGLIQTTGYPLAAPSANLSGRPSPTSATHVLDDLAGSIAGVLDGGDCSVGIESTVIEARSDRILILRPGAIDERALAQFGVPVEFDPHLRGDGAQVAPRAPGQKYRHYAPQGSLQVVFTSRDDAFWRYAADQLRVIHARGGKVAVLATEREIAADLVMPLGVTPTEAATRLYRVLRECDDANVDLIVARGVAPSTGLADPATTALLNRLYKASGGQFISLD